MGSREVIIPYTPRTPQLAIHSALDHNRFVVVVAHRRMGKTVSALNHLIKAADLYLRAIEYHIPKLARTEVSGTNGEPIKQVITWAK